MKNTFHQLTDRYTYLSYFRVFLFTLSLLLGYLNYRGLTVVGHTILTAVIVILVPFLILTALCVPYVKTSNWMKVTITSR